MPTALEAKSLNCWTPREVPLNRLLEVQYSATCRHRIVQQTFRTYSPWKTEFMSTDQQLHIFHLPRPWEPAFHLWVCDFDCCRQLTCLESGRVCPFVSILLISLSVRSRSPRLSRVARFPSFLRPKSIPLSIHFIYPFIHWWTFRLFHLGYYAQNFNIFIIIIRFNLAFMRFL